MLKNLTKTNFIKKSFKSGLNRDSNKQKYAAKTVSYSTSASNEDQEADSTPVVSLPSSTRVVICGGGLFGTSLAYHLGQLGYQNVVLVTRDK